MAFLNPDEYDDERLQQDNSAMAIGSGKLSGKGLYNDSTDSVKNGNNIPEPQTDFIFAIVGEELGFIGCVVIIGLLAFIAVECMIAGASSGYGRASDLFRRCSGHFFPDVYKCRRCNRASSKYRYSFTVCKLRIKFTCCHVFRNRTCTQCTFQKKSYVGGG